MTTAKINPEDLTKEKLKEALSEVFEKYATENYEKEYTYDIKVEVIVKNFKMFLNGKCFDYSDKAVAYGLLTYQIMYYPFNKMNKYENAVIALNTAVKLFDGESKPELEKGFTNTVFNDYEDEADQMLAYINFFHEAFLEQEKPKVNDNKFRKKNKRKVKKNKGGNKYE